MTNFIAARRFERFRCGLLSIAFFHSPNPELHRILAVRQRAVYPPRYPPALYRDLALEFYRPDYFHQEGHRAVPAAVPGAAK